MDFTRRALIAAVLLVGLAGAAYVLWQVSAIVFLVFVGVLIAVALRALSDTLAEHTGLGGKTALGVVVVALLGLTIGAGFLAEPTVTGQVQQMRRSIPDAVEQVEGWLAETQWRAWLPQLASQVTEGNGGQGAPGGATGGTSPSGGDDGSIVLGGAKVGSGVQQLIGWAASYVGTAAQALLGVLFVLFMGLWLAATPRLYIHGLLKLVPPRHQPRASEVLDTTGHQLRWWLVGQLASMIAVGLMIGIGCWILGIPMALLLGILAALLEIIPNFGPILAAVPAVLVGFTSGKVWEVIVLYTGAQFIENYLVRPLAQKKAVDLPPALLLASQVVFGALFGFMGLLVAAPIVVVLIVFVRKLYVEGRLGQDPDEPPLTPA